MGITNGVPVYMSLCEVRWCCTAAAVMYRCCTARVLLRSDGACVRIVQLIVFRMARPHTTYIHSRIPKYCKMCRTLIPNLVSPITWVQFMQYKQLQPYIRAAYVAVKIIVTVKITRRPVREGYIITLNVVFGGQLPTAVGLAVRLAVGTVVVGYGVALGRKG